LEIILNKRTAVAPAWGENVYFYFSNVNMQVRKASNVYFFFHIELCSVFNNSENVCINVAEFKLDCVLCFMCFYHLQDFFTPVRI
jgi:hypothetical protein